MQELPEVLSVYKPIGKTPLEVIKQLQAANPLFQNTKIGYAGRLDPMAEGVLLLLIGHTNKQRKSYEKLSKRYKFSILCGVATDSYDLLGKITEVNIKYNTKQLQQKLAAIIPSFVGTQIQSYPPYSSVRIKGKPLFYWARENKLAAITIPQKEIAIFSLELVAEKLVTSKHLQREVEKRIGLVQGTFRQNEILQNWHKYFSNNPTTTFPVFSFRISCSSGTYVRMLCHDIGTYIGIPTTTYHITRTVVGNYTLSKARKVF